MRLIIGILQKVDWLEIDGEINYLMGVLLSSSLTNGCFTSRRSKAFFLIELTQQFS